MSEDEKSVLVVDDDRAMLNLIGDILKPRGYQVSTATDGATAIEAVERDRPDVVLLDIMMPDMDGFDVCERIREISPVPIIMVTVKEQDDDKVKALDMGADDYLTKPFSSKELAARVRAALRRPILRTESAKGSFSVKDLVVDFNSRCAFLGGEDLHVTSIEYRILSYLALNAGQVVGLDELLARVWGRSQIGNHHMLQVNIERLRRRMGDTGRSKKYIMTEHKVGYMLVTE